jgi:hypothetical protein
MSGEIGILSSQRTPAGFVGRVPERAVLAELSSGDGSTLLVHLHGLAGVGKSALLQVALADARCRGATVVLLDCRAIEPTDRGFLRELNAAIGGTSERIEDIAARLKKLGKPVVLAFDNYEVFRLMDTWLRQIFVPKLGHNVRVIIAGREPPVPAWFASAEWQGLFRSLPLGPLDDRHALELLAACEVGGEAAVRINRTARGHPLALKLAASALTEHPNLGFEDAAVQGVVEQLSRVFLADVGDPLTRQALAAACVVRRTTESLLRAMLPEAAPQDAFERLHALPFVESSRDGLVVHDAVRQASAAALRAADPNRYREYRQAAWRQLHAEMSAAAIPELWRYTADALYLIENPIVRDAFFPSGAQIYTVEPAHANDRDAIQAICDAHEQPKSASQLATWLAAAPEAFSVIRDRDGHIVGFYAMFDPAAVNRASLWRDPLTRKWSQHLRDHPVPKGENVLFLRRWLGIDGGEGPSPIQAAAWLDIKRTYMALRPSLRRVYATVCDIATFAPTISTLHFKPLEEANTEMDSVVYHSALLDFGPSSVDGWLADLLTEELGLEDSITLDTEAGELRRNGQRIALTPLEFGVINHLQKHEGKVATRQALLHHVWGTEYKGGSNIVDSVVHSLRKKLGSQASSIETVRGFGYRFRRT